LLKAASKTESSGRAAWAGEGRREQDAEEDEEEEEEDLVEVEKAVV